MLKVNVCMSSCAWHGVANRVYNGYMHHCCSSSGGRAITPKQAVSHMHRTTRMHLCKNNLHAEALDEFAKTKRQHVLM